MRILKIESLPRKDEYWLDRDCIMFHACFQLLQDFIEIEKGDTHCDYESHKEFVDEVRFLYNWWIKRKEKIHADDEEDSKMLIRLMNIRLNLWT